MGSSLYGILIIGFLHISTAVLGQGDDVSQYFADGMHESNHRIGTDLAQLIRGDANLRYEYLFSDRFGIEAGAGVLLGYGLLPLLGPIDGDGRFYNRDGGYSLYFSPRFRASAKGMYRGLFGFMTDSQLIYGVIINHRSSTGVDFYDMPELEYRETSYMIYAGNELRLGKAIAMEFGAAIGVSSVSGNALDMVLNTSPSTATSIFDFNFSLKFFYIIP